jgi:hypothetical protein
MESPSDPPVATRSAIRCGFAAVPLASLWLFLLSAWLGVNPGRPAATRSDVLFQSDAGQRIRDTLTGTNSFGVGTHFLVSKTWPTAIRLLNRQFSNPEAAAVRLCQAIAALGAGIGLGILVGCLRRIGWSRPECLGALAFLLASSYQIVACLPDHFAFSSGLLPASFGIYLLAHHRALTMRAAIASLAIAGVLAASICLTNAIWPVLLALGLKFKGRRFDRRAALAVGMAALVGFAMLLAIVERHGHRWPVAWQAKHWLNLRLVNDPAGALLRAARGMIDPVVAPSPALDRNNFESVPMLTFEPSEGMPIWPFDGLRSFAALAWLAVLARTLRGPWTPPMQLLSIWIGWNLNFHNLWGDEFFLYSPHYGWALAILPFVSRRMDSWLKFALFLVFIGQLLALNEVAERVREIAA